MELIGKQSDLRMGHCFLQHFIYMLLVLAPGVDPRAYQERLLEITKGWDEFLALGGGIQNILSKSVDWGL